MNKSLFLLMAMLALLTVPFSCQTPAPETPEEIPEEKEDPTPEPPGPEPQDLLPLKCTVTLEGDCIFDSKPSFTLHAENPNAATAGTEVKMDISTDMKTPVTSITKTIEVPANGSADFELTLDSGLEPGFYRAVISAYKRTVRIPIFGIRPFEIKSDPDKQADFDQFWDQAKAQLSAIDMKAELVEITGKSTAKCKVYFVELQSVPDGPEGDPVLIHGYYLEPQDGQPHPVLMHFYGYDTLGSTSKVSCPGGNNGEFAEFYLSHRGQYLNRTTADKREPDGKGDFENIYGDWFAFNFGNRDGYYYRGAFMDCVQAVRFMATRETSDMNNLFAEGSSQGGALSYACAALSDYPFTAISPCVAFLGDYPDYFKIAYWPADVAKKAAKQAGISDEEMYRFLSYFDTKNLATRISCAVIACSGLKDETCPPHTNIAAFNNLNTTDKEYYFYPEMTHEIPKDWNAKTLKFFRARIK